jgi:hypothetical protein
MGREKSRFLPFATLRVGMTKFWEGVGRIPRLLAVPRRGGLRMFGGIEY